MNRMKKNSKKITPIASQRGEFNINDMGEKGAKKYNLFGAVGLYLANVFNLIMILEKLPLWTLARCTVVVFTISLVSYLIMNIKNYRKAYFLCRLIHLELTFFTIYTFVGHYLGLYANSAKILYVFNYLIIHVILFIRRIIIKNKGFIDMIINNKPIPKYFLQDIYVGLPITIVMMSIIKYIDRTPLINPNFELDTVILAMIYILISPVLIALINGGFAMYKFRDCKISNIAPQRREV